MTQRAVLRVVLALAVPFSCAAAAAQDQPKNDPPKVVSLSPPHLAADVDSAKTTLLEITFDRAMSDSGWSFCGGGPAFPNFEGRPEWKNPKTIVAKVKLEPDHTYSLSLNCPAGTNFRSKDGVQLEPVPWSFTTLPAKLPDQKAQKQRNAGALAKLVEAIDGRYAHRDLRVADWKKLVKEHEKALLAAKTDRAWAAAAAQMLAPAKDLHLWLKLGEQTIGTTSRAIDPLFRPTLLAKYAKVNKVADNVLAGRTDDGIGYLMIGEWSGSVDLDAAEKALAELRGCKAFVVDARPNSGGDERLAQRIAAWFVEGTQVYAKNRYRTKPGKDGFGAVLERKLTGNAKEKRIAGPIAVLTSPYVMSSNESFVMMLEQAKDCTTVGQPTFGSSGNPKPADLGNGVTAFVPSWQDLRLDGTCFEGEGLAPDVAVACTAADLEERDPILEKALELLRGKLAQ